MFQITHKALTTFLTLVQFIAQVSGVSSSSEETYSSISIPPASISISLSSTSSSVSPSATAANWNDTKLHVVTVGKLTWRFNPDTITANVGDVVHFEFFPTNHSVVRAEYEYPCIPYEMTGPQKTGFFSGFHPIDVISNEPPSWNLTINDTAPIFFYCAAPGSCIQQGMVGVINPNETETIAVQRAYAKNSSYMLNPGEPFPAEASSVVTLTQAPTSTSPATATTSSALLSATPVPPSRPQGLSSAAVAGIVVGTIVALMLLGALFVYIDRTRSSGSDKDGTPQELDASGAQPHGEASGAQPQGEASGAQPHGFVPIATRLPGFGLGTNQARQGYSLPSGSNVSELGSPTSERNIMSPMSPSVIPTATPPGQHPAYRGKI